MSANLQSPAWLDRQWLQGLGQLHQVLRKRRLLQRKGAQHSPSHGQTREFKDYRPYSKSDDYRAIDWKLYARLEKLYVKLYEEVQELPVHIVIDTSASMKEPFEEKRFHALRLAVALAYLGLINQHRVSLYRLGQHIEPLLLGVRGVPQIEAVIQCLDLMPFHGATAFECVFQHYRPQGPYGLVYVISDAMAADVTNLEQGLTQLKLVPADKYWLQVLHPQERAPDFLGEIELSDVETGEKRKHWFTEAEQQRYQQVFDQFIAEFMSLCEMNQIHAVQSFTDEAPDQLLWQLVETSST